MITASLLGLFVGVLVGLTSAGGGAILTPALILILRVPAALAIGSDVLIASGMKLVGGGAYAWKKQVHWQTVRRLAMGSIPGAALGIVILNHLPRTLQGGLVRQGLGIALLLAGSAIAVRIARATRAQGPATPRATPPASGAQRWWSGARTCSARSGIFAASASEASVRQKMPATATTVALGFLTGILVSITSVGSGSLLLLALSVLFPLPAPMLLGTDIVHSLILSSAATAGHLFSGRVDFALAGAVLLGATPGVLFGARLANSVPERLLRVTTAVALVGVGLNLSLSTGWSFV